MFKSTYLEYNIKYFRNRNILKLFRILIFKYFTQLFFCTKNRDKTVIPNIRLHMFFYPTVFMVRLEAIAIVFTHFPQTDDRFTTANRFSAVIWVTFIFVHLLTLRLYNSKIRIHKIYVRWFSEIVLWHFNAGFDILVCQVCSSQWRI